MARGPAKSFNPDKVLDQAMMEFWKRGYSATSMSHLREVTGLGAKSLYDTYGGKRELFLSALDRYGDQQVNYLFDDVVARLPAREAMAEIFRKLIKLHSKAPHLGCLLGVAAADVEDDPELRAAIAARYVGIQKALEAALSDLPLSSAAPPPSDLSKLLMVLFQGANLVGRVEQEARNAETAIRTAQLIVDQYLKD